MTYRLSAATACDTTSAQDGAIATSASAFEVLPDILSTHASMCAAIDEAAREVVLSTYIFRSDAQSQRLVDALTRAQNRGVRVRILLDGFANGLIWGLRRFLSYFRLRWRGFEVRRYNATLFEGLWPKRWRHINRRYHRKICVVDRNIAFTGSQNIGWVRNLETHFRMEGRVAEVLADVFEADWTNEPFVPASRKEPYDAIPLRLVLSDPTKPDTALYESLLSSVSGARSRIRILTPYFLPDSQILHQLLEARARGVDVELLLPARSNYAFLDWASRHALEPLVQAGCEIRFRRLFDHSKLATFDSREVLVGSSNWDMRSLRHNLELDMFSSHPPIVAAIEKRLDRKRDRSRSLSKAFEPRAAWQVWRDRLAHALLPFL